MLWIFRLVFRLGRCKKEGGNQGGLPKIREVMPIVTLVGTGKPESRENGTHALIYSVRSLLIPNSSELNSFKFLLFFFSFFFKILFSHILPDE